MKDYLISPPAIIREQQAESKSWQAIVKEKKLEVSVVEVKDLEGLTRFEAEFYLPNFLDYKQKVESKFCKSLWELAILDSGPAYSSESILSKKEKDTFSLVKIGDVTNKRSLDQLDFVTKNEIEKFGSKDVKNGDILMTMTGDPPDVGKCNMWNITDSQKLFFNQRVCKIRANNINQYFLYMALSTEFLRSYSERFAMGIRQRNVSIRDIKNIQIPIPKKEFQTKIAELVQKAHAEREKSKTLYAEAEQILLDELELTNWQPTDKNTVIKSSEEVNLYGRADAEFFQPKYDELFEKLEKFEVKPLDEIVDYQKGVEPGSKAYSETGVPFVRVSDVSIKGIKRIEKRVSKELAKSFEGKYSPKKGEILFTKDGTIGISFVVNEAMESILSGAFLRLIPQIKIEAEYLALVLNSMICKMQIERFAGGAIIAHLKPSDAMNLKIPVLNPEIQKSIAEKVTNSHTALANSKHLLDTAKKAVEIYIEQDEAVAEKFIQENV